jgi:carbon monoxide dehydrogenase subunit G
MQLAVDIQISAPRAKVWAAITDIENCTDMISSIIDLDILNLPTDTIVDLKWKETRKMFGKEATETMWITDFVENEYYCTRAESHGSVYITKFSLKEVDGITRLTMSFTAEAQSIFVKMISTIMSLFIENAIKKELFKDLVNIKKYVEKS